MYLKAIAIGFAAISATAIESLGLAGAKYSYPPDVIQCHRNFIEQARPFLHSEGITWDSNFLVDQQITMDRASKIIKWAFTNPEFKKEVLQGFDSHGGLKSPVIWEHYLRVYDLAVIFSREYFYQMWQVSTETPHDATVLDIGSGTGNYPFYLLFESPRRSVIGIDWRGIAVTEQKLGSLDPAKRKWQIFPQDIKNGLPLEDNSVDVVVINNVAYAIGSQAKDEERRDRVLDLLKEAARVCKSAGKIFFADPSKTLQENPEILENLLLEFAEDIVNNRSIMTEFQFASGVLFNLMIYEPGAAKYFSFSEQMQLGKDAGLILLEAHRTYYRHSGFLIFQKPRVD